MDGHIVGVHWGYIEVHFYIFPQIYTFCHNVFLSVEERGMELPGKILAPASIFVLSSREPLLLPDTRLAASRLAEVI